MTDVSSNCLWYIAILRTIGLGSNELGSFFGLLYPFLSPYLSQSFGRCTLRPSLRGRNIELNPFFAYRGRLFSFHEPCLMDVIFQLSPVNFPTESSPLPSPGIELILFGYVTGSNQRLYPLYHVSLIRGEGNGELSERKLTGITDIHKTWLEQFTPVSEIKS